MGSSQNKEKIELLSDVKKRIDMNEGKVSDEEDLSILLGLLSQYHDSDNLETRYMITSNKTNPTKSDKIEKLMIEQLIELRLKKLTKIRDNIFREKTD